MFLLLALPLGLTTLLPIGLGLVSRPRLAKLRRSLTNDHLSLHFQVRATMMILDQLGGPGVIERMAHSVMDRQDKILKFLIFLKSSHY